MRHEDLLILLKVGGHRDDREIPLLGQEIAEKIASLEEVDLARKQKHAAVALRAARQDGDVEPVFGVSAVDDGLVIPSGLRVGQPVQAKRDFVERKRGIRRGEKGRESGEGNRADRSAAIAGNSASTPTFGLPIIDRRGMASRFHFLHPHSPCG